MGDWGRSFSFPLPSHHVPLPFLLSSFSLASVFFSTFLSVPEFIVAIVAFPIRVEGRQKEALAMIPSGSSSLPPFFSFFSVFSSFSSIFFLLFSSFPTDEPRTNDNGQFGERRGRDGERKEEVEEEWIKEEEEEEEMAEEDGKEVQEGGNIGVAVPPPFTCTPGVEVGVIVVLVFIIITIIAVVVARLLVLALGGGGGSETCCSCCLGGASRSREQGVRGALP